ncbi:hypothetical protein V5P93_004073 [Actinokineospora auranticolor]|uniref:hypothetical protein n=1 Tax=Actinokineospora auranticolor TaxID=155976 RepID=UPI0011B0C0F6|nr:hypothetical protein [Actinokineospora auranticolor]
MTGEIEVPRGAGVVVVPVTTVVHGENRTVKVHAPAGVHDGALLPIGTEPDGPYVRVRLVRAKVDPKQVTKFAAMVVACATAYVLVHDFLAYVDRESEPRPVAVGGGRKALEGTPTRHQLPIVFAVVGEDIGDVEPGACLRTPEGRASLLFDPGCRSGSYRVVDILAKTISSTDCLDRPESTHVAMTVDDKADTHVLCLSRI